MHKPRFYYGWVIVALAFISMGFAYGIWYSFSVFFVAVLRDFGLSRANAALAFSVFVIVHGITAPIIGKLIDRFGIRSVATTGSLVLAASLASCSFVTELWQYYLTFGVLSAIGVNAAGIMPNYVALTRWFVKRRGMVIGIASAGIALLGLATLVPLNQYLISSVGWRSTYLILAITIGLTLPILHLVFQRDRPQDLGLLPDGLPMAPQEETSMRMPPIQQREWTVRSALVSYRFWTVSVAQLLAAIGMQTIFVHQVAYFTDLGRSPLLAASVVGLIGLVSIPLKVIGGSVSDRMGRELIYTFGIALVVTGIAILLLLHGIPVDWPLYLYALIFGSGYAIHTTLIPTISSDIFAGRHFAVIYGFVLVFSATGAAIGPYLAGYIFDVTSSYTPAFVIAAITMMLATLSFWIAAPRRERRIARQIALSANNR